MAVKISTLEHIVSKAIEDKEYASATRAIRLICELAGLIPTVERRNRSGHYA